jgi:tetratricopeptide (TPR) repeat protein
MSEPNANPKDQAEAYAASAARALDGGDWRAALSHLAHALPVDPFRTEWTALLDRALDAAGAELGAFLKESGHKPGMGFQALKAYAAYRAGDFKTAFNDLQNLTRNVPSLRFAEAWGFGWFSDDAIRAAGQNALQFLASSVHNRYPEAEHLSDADHAHLTRAIGALERFEAILGPSGHTIVFKGQMLSKAGRFAEAISVAEGAARADPTFNTAIAAAMAHKRAGDFDGAVRWFWRASELDLQNETGLLDIGDICADRGLWDQGLRAYDEALKRKPNHDWAHPSAVYCRFRLTGDPALLEELRYMANAAPDECGMADLMKQMMGGYNFEDRRRRAEFLMKQIEPHFVPTPRPHEHHDEEDEHEEEHEDDAENS